MQVHVHVCVIHVSLLTCWLPTAFRAESSSCMSAVALGSGEEERSFALGVSSPLTRPDA